jgi:hypothetical protein
VDGHPESLVPGAQRTGPHRAYLCTIHPLPWQSGHIARTPHFVGCGTHPFRHALFLHRMRCGTPLRRVPGLYAITYCITLSHRGCGW